MASPEGVSARPPAAFGAVGRSASSRAIIVGAGVIAGAMTAWLSRFGTLPQAALAVGLAAGMPLLMLFIARPHVALAVYLCVLPLIKAFPIAFGLNGGEIVSLLVMLIGALTLWAVQDRIVPTLVRLRSLVVPLALLAVISLVSLVVNEIDRFEDIASALFKIIAFAALPVLIHAHVRDPRQAKGLITALLLGGAAVTIYTLISYIFGWSYSAEYDWKRPVGTFQHWNHLGGFMALVSPPTLGLAAVSKGARRIAFGALFGLEIAVLFLSQTLGSMAGVIIGSGVVLVFLMRPRLSRLLPVLLIAVVAATAAFATDPLLRDKVTRIDERLDDRLRTYATGAMMFRDRFWWGFGSEQVMAEELMLAEADYWITSFGPSSVIPHNAVLKVAVEKGVFGVVTFIVLVAGAVLFVLRQRHRFRGTDDALLYYGILAGLFAFLVQNMTNDLLLHARLGILFFSLVALVDRLAPLHPSE